MSAFEVSALEIPSCSALQRYLLVLLVLQSLRGAAKVSTLTADPIGEFQWELQSGVYFSSNCRPTPVHLLVSLSLRSSSRAKLRNSGFQGLLRNQVPPSLKKNPLLVCTEGFAKLRASLLPSVSFRVKLLHHFPAVFPNCSVANRT